MAEGKRAGVLRRWASILVGMLRQRCPRCGEGRIFRGSFAMNDPCPRCGLIFQREEGYFLGAMYVSYLLASAAMIGFYFALRALLPDGNGLVLAQLAGAAFVPLVPAVFRYSRVVWIYFERGGCPGDASAGAFEKARRKQFAEQGTADRAD